MLRDQWLLDSRDTTRNRYTRNMLGVVLAARGDFAGGIEHPRFLAIAWARHRPGRVRIAFAPDDAGVGIGVDGVRICEMGAIA